MMMKRLLTTRWILSTILVVLGAAVCIRLGFWQLDRLTQRRLFNARVAAQIVNEPLVITPANLTIDFYEMEFRKVSVQGTFLYDEEVLLRNQAWEEQPGYHIITPLQITGSDYAILVDRGWIPSGQAGPIARKAYQQAGSHIINGVIRRPQTKPDFGGVPDPTLAPGQTRLDAWNIVNLGRITAQTSIALLPVYIQAELETGSNEIPYRSVFLPEISDGSHLSYAIQWFFFATLLGLGYPFYLRKQLRGINGN
jgi:surfeit locus 1 family protein